MLALLYVLVSEGAVDEEFVAAHATGWEALRARGCWAGRRSAGCRRARRRTDDARVGRGRLRHAGGAHRRAGARVGAPPARRPDPRPLGAAHVGRGGGGAPGGRAAGSRPATSGASAARRGGRPGAALPEPRMGTIPVPPNPASRERRRQRLGARSARGSRRRLPRTSAPCTTCGGNYVVQGADVALNLRAMQAPEFSVCHDLFLTTTARQCDVVLPATHWLERERHRLHLGGLPAVLAPGRGAAGAGPPRLRHLRRHRRPAGLSATPSRRARTRRRGCDDFVAASEVTDEEEFRRTGIHCRRRPRARRAGGLRRRPGAAPAGARRAARSSSAGEACVAAGLSEVPEARLLPADEARPLRLVTPKSRFRIHSQLADHARGCAPATTARCGCTPRDAAARGIARRRRECEVEQRAGHGAAARAG